MFSHQLRRFVGHELSRLLSPVMKREEEEEEEEKVEEEEEKDGRQRRH